MMLGPFGSELAKIRVETLREDARRGSHPRPTRSRVALGRAIVGAGARLMGACPMDVLAAVEGRRQ